MTVGRTEAQHRHAKGIHSQPPAVVLARLLESQQAAAAAVAPALPALAAAPGRSPPRSAQAAASAMPAPAARA